MAQDKRIDGLDGTQTNPDTTNTQFPSSPWPSFKGQLDPDPDHHFRAWTFRFSAAHPQTGRVANMQGFIKSYFQQQTERPTVPEDHVLLHSGQVAVLTGLATQFAVFNGWFSPFPDRPSATAPSLTTEHRSARSA